MKYTFKNGAVVEGSVTQLMDIAKALGETLDLTTLPRETGWYHSTSLGRVRIVDMKPDHLKNALLKRTRAYFEALSSRKLTSWPTLQDFLNDYEGLAKDPLTVELMSEVMRRAATFAGRR